MKILIKSGLEIPIYKQVEDQIKNQILKGDLNEGYALPSIRQLAKDLKISVITTSRAYSDLETNGFITAIKGKGYYVGFVNKKLFREEILKNIKECFHEGIKKGIDGNIEKKEMYEMYKKIVEEYYE